MIKKRESIISMPTKRNRYRVTATLLNSWQNIFDCKDYVFESEDDEISYEEKLEDAREKAKQEFINMLNRVPVEDNIYMQKGREYEDFVCSGGDGIFSPIIEGGAFQVTIKKNIQIDDITICLYGVLDVLKQGRIYDIKRVTKYKYPKYKKSHQHSIYLYLVPEAIDFTYIICDDNIDSPLAEKRRDAHHFENYIRENCEDIEQVLRDFISYLKQNDLIEIFKSKWLQKN